MSGDTVTFGTVPPWIAAELVTLAWCWRLSRRDGVTVGLTSHDRPLIREGLRYDPAPGMTPSRVEQDASLDPDTMDIKGAISSRALRADDIDAGRWDGAALTLSVCDWDDADVPLLTVATGTLGALERDGQAFTAELSVTPAWLARPAAPVTSPTCRAQFGDAQCGVNLAQHRATAQVIASDGDVVTLDAAHADVGLLVFGTLRWRDGPATGLAATVLAQDGATLTLSSVPTALGPLPVRVEVTTGCDRTLATCATRYTNAAAFRGEPHLPGNDLLTRFPGD